MPIFLILLSFFAGGDEGVELGVGVGDVVFSGGVVI